MGAKPHRSTGCKNQGCQAPPGNFFGEILAGFISGDCSVWSCFEFWSSTFCPLGVCISRCSEWANSVRLLRRLDLREACLQRLALFSLAQKKKKKKSPCVFSSGGQHDIAFEVWALNNWLSVIPDTTLIQISCENLTTHGLSLGATNLTVGWQCTNVVFCFHTFGISKKDSLVGLSLWRSRSHSVRRYVWWFPKCKEIQIHGWQRKCTCRL